MGAAAEAQKCPSTVNNKDCVESLSEELSYKEDAEPDKCLQEVEACQTDGYKRFRSSESLSGDTVQPFESPAGRTVCSRFPAFGSCHPVGTDFPDTAVFEAFLLI